MSSVQLGSTPRLPGLGPAGANARTPPGGVPAPASAPLTPRRLMVVGAAAICTLAGATLSPTFHAAPISVDIVWSLTFAILVAIAEGRQAALAVAVLGIAPVPFLLWPNNGWANLAGAGQYLIWVGWQAWCAEWRQRNPSPWNYPLVAQIALLPVQALVLLVLFPVALRFNPPPWGPAAVTEIPGGVLIGLLVKDALTLGGCVLGALCLLKLPAVRPVLGLPVPSCYRLNTRVMGSVAIGVVVLWLMVLTLDRFLIKAGATETGLSIGSPYEIVSLFVITAAALAAGLAVCGFAERILTAEDDLLAADWSLRRTLVQLRNANLDMERFTSVAAHDLQEPVRTVVSFSQMLEHHIGSRLDPIGREYLDYIISGARRMKALALGLLDYSHIADKVLRVEPVSAGDLLAEVLNGLRPMIVNRGISIEIGNAPEVMGDREQLRQLFRHLIDNAIKFRDPDRETHIRLDARRTEAGDCEFSIADNGIGIPKDYWDSVFEAFRRLHPVDSFPGVGIGLTLARHIVQEHGGHIWVAGGEPGSTTIKFTLPAAGSGAITR